MIGRKKEYTNGEVEKRKCVRCGGPGWSQWQICALDQRHCVICQQCDIALNHLVLVFMRVPNPDKHMEKYKGA